MDITTLETLLMQNGDIIFTAILILGIIIISAVSGVRNGIVLYLLSVLGAVIAVTIGAVSGTVLVYLLLPIIILIVIKIIFKAGGEQ